MDFGGAEGIAQARLSRITPLSRQALLLTSLEGFSSEDTGYLIDATPGRTSTAWSPRRWRRSSGRPTPTC